MKAFLDSKFQRPARAFLSVAFLVFSLLGTHWLGYEHSIAHPIAVSHSSDSTLTHADQHHHAKPADSGHLKAHCLLFDALTLAGLVGSSNIAFTPSLAPRSQPTASGAASIPGVLLFSYESRAPPRFIQS
ncbi:MAG: hypothetical protein Q8R65_06200 [Polynucleobacter sp.]|nr:hypothetical protein [Polynucleobacter sp.]MDZ4056883.1 hypothetical protein [Polynucleobacter sp.]